VKRRSGSQVIACVVMLVALAACGRDREQAPAAPQSLEIAQLQNAEYASQWSSSGSARLVNGEFREPAAPGAATELVVRATEFHAFGDVDGDGAADAAIVIESDPGGSGVFFDLFAVLNRAGQPLPLAPVELGDRVQVNGLVIHDGAIRLELLKQGPDDPQCCPTVPVRATYALERDHLVAVEDQEPSRSSASPASR
jgi:hypothetical protein